jgi:hypothetical protein
MRQLFHNELLAMIIRGPTDIALSRLLCAIPGLLPAGKESKKLSPAWSGAAAQMVATISEVD